MIDPAEPSYQEAKAFVDANLDYVEQMAKFHYREQWREMYGYVYEAAIRLARKFDASKFHGSSSITKKRLTYISTLLRNRVTDLYRMTGSGCRHPDAQPLRYPLSLDFMASGERVERVLIDRRESPASAVMSADTFSWLLEGLTAKEKLMCRLCFEEGMEQAEAAKAIGVSQSYVSQMMAHAKEVIRSRFVSAAAVPAP